MHYNIVETFQKRHLGMFVWHLVGEISAPLQANLTACKGEKKNREREGIKEKMKNNFAKEQ